MAGFENREPGGEHSTATEQQSNSLIIDGSFATG